MSLCNFSPPFFFSLVLLVSRSKLFCATFTALAQQLLKSFALNFCLVEREVQIKEAADGPFVTE